MIVSSRAALILVVLTACSPSTTVGDPGTPLPEPTVTFDVRGQVLDPAPDGATDRVLVAVTEVDHGIDPGDAAIVVFDPSVLACRSGGDPDGPPAADAEVWLQGVGGQSDSDPPILHPDRIVLDC